MDHAAVAQAAVEKFIAEEARNLADADKRAKAMAGLCILLTQLQEPSVPKELEDAIPSIVELTAHSEDRSIQVIEYDYAMTWVSIQYAWARRLATYMNLHAHQLWPTTRSAPPRLESSLPLNAPRHHRAGQCVCSAVRPVCMH